MRLPTDAQQAVDVVLFGGSSLIGLSIPAL
jgi:hypothetical protein